jgi:hypothetical protein
MPLLGYDAGGFCNNQSLGGTYHLHHQGEKSQRTTGDVLLLLVTANVVPSPTILVILMMEAILPSKALVLTKATWRNIPFFRCNTVCIHR